MRGLVTGAAGRTLVGVQRGEERVEPRARLGWADAAERGEDDGQKGATDVLAPTAHLVRIPAPQAWLPQRTLSVSMVSTS